MGRYLFRQYMSAPMLQVKSLCIVGGPGYGKTTVMRLLQMDSIGLGLSTMTTTLLCKRALELGGIHWHKLASLPVNEYCALQWIAELALFVLYQKPERMAMLQRLDVLCIDELGQLSAGQIACLIVILCQIHGSSKFLGGILVVATMDPCQLKHIKGDPTMLSPLMITGFNFHCLEHSDWVGRDQELHRLQEIARMAPSSYTPSVLAEFGDVIQESCTFVASWESPVINNNNLRVFGTNEAVHDAKDTLLAKLRNQNTMMLVSVAQDEEMSKTSHSNWVTASDATSKGLDRAAKEACRVHFFSWAVYKMMHNDPIIGFSQSQITVLADTPMEVMELNIRVQGKIKLMLAPKGCKGVPEGLACTGDLLAHGWKVIYVGLSGKPRSYPMAHSVTAHCLQYGFCHHIASTIHGAMGCDVDKLVTSISSIDPKYHLWEKEQVIVLVLHTFFVVDLIFVGSPNDMIATLTNLIQKQSQYCEYIAHLLDALCRVSAESLMNDAPMIDNGLHPFRPKDVFLPEDPSGYCYILLSL